jgi:Holliday junction resolvase
MAAEKNFENKIKNYLKEKGIWYVKYFANGFTRRGVPDLLCCVNGKFVAVEVKAQNGHPSELQVYEQKSIMRAGGVAVILYPSGFDKFKKMIEEML